MVKKKKKKKSNNNESHHLHDPNGTIRKLKPTSHRRRDGLIQYSYDKTSQSGEDGIIHYLFQKIPCSNNDGIRWAVDIGAWDGIHLSNTYSLLTESESESSSSSPSRWKGILIEADEEKFKQLKSLHEPKGNICHNIAVSCQPWSTQNLAQILLLHSNQSSDQQQHHQHHLPNNFDFLCIDVDGTDYWILHNLLHDTPFRPKVICIEFNPTIPHSVLFIPPRDDNIRQGCSITALDQLASSFDYTLVETTCYNAFFVHQPFFQSSGIQNDIPFNPSIDNLHEVTMGTSLYQLYDGTIKLSGCQKMLWHRKPIREEDIQILKKEERNFPFAPSTTSTTGDDGTSSTGIDISDDSNSNTCNQKKSDGNNVELLNQDNQHMMYHHLAIDMSPYCCPPSSSTTKAKTKTTITDQKTKCSTSIYQQLSKDGFALIRGTGISPLHCQNALSCTKKFFQNNSTTSEKVRRSCLTKDRARRGYSPQNSENFASLIGQKGSNDLVRKFRVGPCIDDDDIDTGTSVGMGDNNNNTGKSIPSSLYQPNAWPTEETWGEENATKFKSHIETYYTHICQVANNIVNAICDGITNHNSNIILPSSLIGGFGTTCDVDKEDKEGSGNEEEQQRSIENTSILTLLGYRKGARHQGRHSNPLIAAHTDVGVITVLLFDGGDCATLQRCQSSHTDDDDNDDDDNNDNECRNVNNHHSWVDVKLPTTIPQDPIFVVNIGDCLSDMCDNALPSTLHRVMPCKGGTVDRNCLALFMGLNHDEILTLPNGDSMMYEEWRRRRIARAQDVLVKHRGQNKV